MIISHEHKFIFIKTKKTAGTSIEIALSKYCGPADVITSVVAEDEAKRSRLGYRGPQNYRVPLRQLSIAELVKMVCFRERLSFYNHISANFVRGHIDSEVWDSYFKFCFERNPWDKVISWYYWMNKTEPRPCLSDYIQRGEAAKACDFDLYASRSGLLVDRVFKYENIQEAMKEISDRVGLPEVPQLPSTKSGHRKADRDYRQLLSEQDIQMISRVFAREIAYFDYHL